MCYEDKNASQTKANAAHGTLMILYIKLNYGNM